MGEESRARPRNEHGQYVDRIPLDRVLNVFEEREDFARPLTATDVMEALDCSRRTAHNKLNELEERGDLATRKVGARSRVWWVPMTGPEGSPNTGVQADPTDTTDAARPTSDRPPAVSNAIADADLPGSGPMLDARREALAAAYEYLADHPEAKKADFLRDVYHDYPAGFESAEGWWNAIQPALKQLPGVDPPEERGHIWHFLGG
ncbi:helix-turn-helix transcriptional regulator [Halogeometricum borinquense]|uniref:Helix-turn-helix transcriptional regulator n=1 Tax=Halogeometricum borinquense TaxID=60847 RepID=A0A6C0UJA0_9EURY|nr:helix-turn-helix transcriptional regulator [Halogeometricum borinquense]QIB74663.1 helix-turn-helix transcriptional regulator [Halogeometricum borinquense]QIQ76384.1 helix-turn-helix transcriptional regulator [Halogeometricum borinquense]